MQGLSIRALEVVNDSTVWFAANDGIVGHTTNSGMTWSFDTLSYNTLTPEFRSIASHDGSIFLLSIANPALLYKSSNQGKDWSLVYTEEHPNVFYDALTFNESGHGVAMGDPTDGCLSIIISQDYGESWNKVPCDNLPPTVEGEAGFAASNSNVQMIDDTIWVVSGGMDARVFRSTDAGTSWEVFDTPIISGGQMTGIFSLHFYDTMHGVIIGGDWSDKEMNVSNKAITSDGGETWQLIADGQSPGYRSSIRYRPNSNAKEIIAVGTPGISYSNDGGISWEKMSNDNFYTIRFSKSGNHAWLAGHEKIARMEW